MKSFKEYRFEENPMEKEFVDKFNKDIVSRGLVKNIVFGNIGRQLQYDEERVVLSTIQWLGSPVGQSFLSEMGFKLNK